MRSPLSLAIAAVLASSSLLCAHTAFAGAGRLERAFNVLEKSATGSYAEALKAFRELVRLEDRVLSQLPRKRALGLLTMIRFVKRGVLSPALEEAISTGDAVDKALFEKLRAASMRWVERARDAGHATLKRLRKTGFDGFFGHLRALVDAGWAHVMRVATAAATHDALALQRATSLPRSLLRKSYLAFGAWAERHGVEAVREAFEDTLRFLEEGKMPPSWPTRTEPVALR